MRCVHAKDDIFKKMESYLNAKRELSEFEFSFRLDNPLALWYIDHIPDSTGPTCGMRPE